MKNVYYSEDNRGRLIVKCSCGCSSLDIDQWENGMVFISQSIPSFYALQITFWDRLKKIVKMIWSIVIGKEYILYEIIIDNSRDIKKFKKHVSQLEEKCSYKNFESEPE